MKSLEKFFHNKATMIVESVLLGASAIGLTLGGVSQEGVQSIASMSVAVLSAVDAVATLITALLGKKE